MILLSKKSRKGKFCMKKNRPRELAEIWLEKAKDDLLWAKDTFEDKRFSGVCFLTQQAVEKTLKAYLFSQRQSLIRTHNLERLLERCSLFDKDFLSVRRHCQILNTYYTDTRYPDIWDMSRFEDEVLASEALDLAYEVIQFVEKKLS